MGKVSRPALHMSTDHTTPPIFKLLRPKDRGHLTTVTKAENERNSHDNMTSEQT